MLAIYIVAILALMGSDSLLSKAHAGFSGSSDSSDSSKSSDSKSNGEQHCRNSESAIEVIAEKIKSLKEKKSTSSHVHGKNNYFRLSHYVNVCTIDTCRPMHAPLVVSKIF